MATNSVKQKLDSVVADSLGQISAQIERGFKQVGEFFEHQGQLDYRLWESERETGVYAFVIDGEVVYVGEAKLLQGLKRRLYGYKMPGSTQRTNQRLKPLLLRAVKSGMRPQIWFFAMRHLEPELIRNLQPSWNLSLKKTEK